MEEEKGLAVNDQNDSNAANENDVEVNDLDLASNNDSSEVKVNALKQNNIKIRSLTNLIGVGLMLITGLFFILLVDLQVKVKESELVPISTWLFVSVLFSLGGAIFYFFGDSLKHKRIATIVLKSIGLFLSVGFIPFLFVFMNWVQTSGMVKSDAISSANIVVYVSLALAIVSLIVLIVNFVFSIVFLSDEY